MGEQEISSHSSAFLLFFVFLFIYLFSPSLADALHS